MPYIPHMHDPLERKYKRQSKESILTEVWWPSVCRTNRKHSVREVNKTWLWLFVLNLQSSREGAVGAREPGRSCCDPGNGCWLLSSDKSHAWGWCQLSLALSLSPSLSLSLSHTFTNLKLTLKTYQRHHWRRPCLSSHVRSPLRPWTVVSLNSFQAG